MKSVLSTKRLSPSQRNLLIRAGVSLVDYNAIKIDFKPFKAPSNIANALFTSQNAVKATQDLNLQIKNCFCVGEKTKALLQENGQNVIKMTEYASEMANYLVKNHKNDCFHFFCGNLRSDEIPSKLKAQSISFEEIEVYNTTLNPKHFQRQFNAVLFFSPSGVRSYFEANNPDLQGVVEERDHLVGLKEERDHLVGLKEERDHLAGLKEERDHLAGLKEERDHLVGLKEEQAHLAGLGQLAICIGTTTAQEAKKHTENVVISNATTVESVIVKTVKMLIS